MRAEQQQRPPSAPATCPAACVPAERCKRSRARQIFGIGCLLASLVGVLLVASAVKRSGKASIVVFLLAFVRPAERSLALALQSRVKALEMLPCCRQPCFAVVVDASP